MTVFSTHNPVVLVICCVLYFDYPTVIVFLLTLPIFSLLLLGFNALESRVFSRQSLYLLEVVVKSKSVYTHSTLPNPTL